MAKKKFALFQSKGNNCSGKHSWAAALAYHQMTLMLFYLAVEQSSSKRRSPFMDAGEINALRWPYTNMTKCLPKLQE